VQATKNVHIAQKMVKMNAVFPIVISSWHIILCFLLRRMKVLV